jgi:hypothetical protein
VVLACLWGGCGIASLLLYCSIAVPDSSCLHICNTLKDASHPHMLACVKSAAESLHSVHVASHDVLGTDDNGYAALLAPAWACAARELFSAHDNCRRCDPSCSSALTLPVMII